MTGNNDPDCRKPMNWHPDEPAWQMHDFVQQLIHLRQQYWQLIAQGSISFQALPNNQGLQVIRQSNNQKLIGTFNTSSHSMPLTDAISGKALLNQEYNNQALAPHGFIITLQ